MEKENVNHLNMEKNIIVDSAKNSFDIVVDNIFNHQSLVQNLSKNFYINMSFEDILEFEKDFTLLNIFDSEYMLVHSTSKLFFNYVTSRYELFLLNEIKDELYNIGIKNTDNVYINRYGVYIDSENIAYSNSYSKYYKESLIYKPLFISVSNFKHSKTPKIKRNDLINKLQNVINFSNEYMVSIKDISMYPEFVIETIDTIGVRTLCDYLRLDSERIWNKYSMEDKLEFVKELNVNNIGNYINFLNNAYKYLFRKEKFNFNGFIKISEKFTAFIVSSLNASFF